MTVQTPVRAFFFDPDELMPLAQRLGPEYRQGEPYPHIVIDDFLPPDVLEAVLEEFPAPDSDRWFRHDQQTERKLERTVEATMGAHTRQLLNQFNGGPMMDFLEELTG